MCSIQPRTELREMQVWPNRLEQTSRRADWLRRSAITYRPYSIDDIHSRIMSKNLSFIMAEKVS